MSDDQIPQRPYLYRALHEWMTDNGHTPHIVVDANAEHTAVPTQFVEDGRIVLNISYSATKNLVLGNEAISFEARFGGQPFGVSVPAEAVLAIYARETGEGMMFGDDAAAGEPAVSDEEAAAGDDAESSGDLEPDPPDGPDRSHLRVVK